MQVWTLGLNHRTADVSIRERFALDASAVREALHDLRQRIDPQLEVALLSTCNRTEIYAAGANDVRSPVLEWMANLGRTTTTGLQDHVYAKSGHEAAHHAFRVASGLDSMVLGEPQILGQVKAAVRLAQEQGTLGKTLNQLFQHSFTVAKQVRSRTEIGSQSISMAAAAVKLATRLFEDLKSVNVLMVGAGEMIELCAAHFHAQQPRRMTIANRSVERRSALAQRYSADDFALSELPQRLHEYDVIISCTGSSLPIIGLGAVRQAVKQRKSRPMFMLDLAVPRDIEPQVTQLRDVYLYSVDDLAQLVQAGVAHRQQASEQAERIVVDGVERFQSWMQQRSQVPVIQQLLGHAQQVHDAEMVRVMQELQRGQDVDKVLASFSHRMRHKLLHGFLHTLNSPCPHERGIMEQAVHKALSANTRESGRGQRSLVSPEGEGSA